jgi:hypothetical protein
VGFSHCLPQKTILRSNKFYWIVAGRSCGCRSSSSHAMVMASTSLPYPEPVASWATFRKWTRGGGVRGREEASNAIGCPPPWERGGREPGAGSVVNTKHRRGTNRCGASGATDSQQRSDWRGASVADRRRAAAAQWRMRYARKGGVDLRLSQRTT